MQKFEFVSDILLNMFNTEKEKTSRYAQTRRPTNDSSGHKISVRVRKIFDNISKIILESRTVEEKNKTIDLFFKNLDDDIFYDFWSFIAGRYLEDTEIELEKIIRDKNIQETGGKEWWARFFKEYEPGKIGSGSIGTPEDLLGYLSARFKAAEKSATRGQYAPSVDAPIGGMGQGEGSDTFGELTATVDVNREELLSKITNIEDEFKRKRDTLTASDKARIADIYLNYIQQFTSLFHTSYTPDGEIIQYANQEQYQVPITDPIQTGVYTPGYKGPRTLDPNQSEYEIMAGMVPPSEIAAERLLGHYSGPAGTTGLGIFSASPLNKAKGIFTEDSDDALYAQIVVKALYNITLRYIYDKTFIVKVDPDKKNVLNFANVKEAARKFREEATKYVEESEINNKKIYKEYLRSTTADANAFFRYIQKTIVYLPLVIQEDFMEMAGIPSWIDVTDENAASMVEKALTVYNLREFKEYDKRKQEYQSTLRSPFTEQARGYREYVEDREDPDTGLVIPGKKLSDADIVRLKDVKDTESTRKMLSQFTDTMRDRARYNAILEKLIREHGGSEGVKDLREKAREEFVKQYGPREYLQNVTRGLPYYPEFTPETISGRGRKRSISNNLIEEKLIRIASVLIENNKKKEAEQVIDMLVEYALEQNGEE